MRWASKVNGELLRLAVAASFDVFVTMDQNLRYQQNLPSIPISVIGLIAKSNRIQALVPLLPQLREALASIRPGELLHISTEI
jgi:hypothetical protein